MPVPIVNPRPNNLAILHPLRVNPAPVLRLDPTDPGRPEVHCPKPTTNPLPKAEPTQQVVHPFPERKLAGLKDWAGLLLLLPDHNT